MGTHLGKLWADFLCVWEVSPFQLLRNTMDGLLGDTIYGAARGAVKFFGFWEL